MYLPTHFREERSNVLQALMIEHPLATLVIATPSGLVANHLPMEFDPQTGPKGTLRGHIARANPIWQAGSVPPHPLAIFQGPLSAYISPSHYPSKHETGRAVPTWNYAVVHASGPIQFIHDLAWLRALVERLTNHHEADRSEPWQVADAPHQYTESQLKAIVGIEIQVESLVGKWKVSQNRSERDSLGVAHGLGASQDSEARAVGGLVEQYRSERN